MSADAWKEPLPAELFEVAVVRELERQRAQREAKRRLDAEERPAFVLPEILTLRERLARPKIAKPYRIDGWLPSGGRGMVAAQFKTGKTTLIENTMRSLLDGDRFLGSAAVQPLVGKLAVIDTEMSDHKLDEWLADQGVICDDRAIVVSLRGQVRAFDLLDDRVRAAWATRLRSDCVEFLILDCLRPVLDAIGLDEKSEAGVFLTAFDALLRDAGISEALVVHHMGHAGERSRGDSRLRDWPDTEWKLMRKDEDERSPRFISAYGRDVDIPEAGLRYDPHTRRLTLVGGSRRESQLEDVIVDIIEAIDRSPGPLSGRGIVKAMADSSHGKHKIEAALKLGAKSGRLACDPAPRGKPQFYRRASQCPGVSQACSGDSVGECPGPYRGPDSGTPTTPFQFDGRPT
jgi:hypothetical protein